MNLLCYQPWMRAVTHAYSQYQYYRKIKNWVKGVNALETIPDHLANDLSNLAEATIKGDLREVKRLAQRIDKEYWSHRLKGKL